MVASEREARAGIAVKNSSAVLTDSGPRQRRWLLPPGEPILGTLGHRFGHRSPPMYGEMFEAFGLRRVIWAIKAFESLPDQGERFDLVTAFSICFNEHKKPGLWGPKQWDFLLQDLKNHFLQPSGEIFLGLNPEPNDSFYSPGLREFFLAKGAKIDREKVWFKKLDGI